MVDQIDFINGIRPIYSLSAGLKSSDETLNKEEIKVYEA